jgi:hypothetical protein
MADFALGLVIGSSIGIGIGLVLVIGLIHFHGPKDDGTYIIEFRTAEGQSLAITIRRTEAAVIKHFQARMPYGLILPDDPLEVGD